METSLNNINFYLTAVEAIRGVSRDMNAAVNAHLISITRVRDVTAKIRKSCSDGLRHLEGIKP